MNRIQKSSSLSEKNLVNMWDNTSAWDSSFNKTVEFFVTSDSELEMSWGDSSHLEIFGGVSSQFQYLSGQVFENSCTIYGGRSTNPVLLGNALFQESMDSSYWELLRWG